MHYLELDAEGRFVGVFPLEQEIANTEFYDGTLLLVPATMDFPPCRHAISIRMAGCHRSGYGTILSTYIPFNRHFPVDA